MFFSLLVCLLSLLLRLFPSLFSCLFRTISLFFTLPLGLPPPYPIPPFLSPLALSFNISRRSHICHPRASPSPAFSFPLHSLPTSSPHTLSLSLPTPPPLPLPLPLIPSRPRAIPQHPRLNMTHTPTIPSFPAVSPSLSPTAFTLPRSMSFNPPLLFFTTPSPSCSLAIPPSSYLLLPPFIPSFPPSAPAPLPYPRSSHPGLPWVHLPFPALVLRLLALFYSLLITPSYPFPPSLLPFPLYPRPSSCTQPIPPTLPMHPTHTPSPLPFLLLNPHPMHLIPPPHPPSEQAALSWEIVTL